MSPAITVGLDGSPESLAAAEWAAREAALRALPLQLIHVGEPTAAPNAQAPSLDAATLKHWSERIPREAAQGLSLRHPGIEVSTRHLAGQSSEVLLDVASDAAMLVLGSRGLSGIRGFMTGSVGLAVVAQAKQPVTLVRADGQAANAHTQDPAGIPSAATPFRPVVLGLDTANPDDSVIEFAFDAAARRDTTLRAVHSWALPPSYVYSLGIDFALHDELTRQQATALTDLLSPWQRKFPTVEVVTDCRTGNASAHLIDASRDACLVVVGRRVRRSAVGAHIGPVTHAVLHHATAPVTVVAHN
ncbi:universal stress protein [Streptomyces sp. A5-4]|uniref:universal stress protein n=1 Tax=Streptomyces sp. A5-4 TaxID=3384771 RepID=UPI003DA95B72